MKNSILGKMKGYRRLAPTDVIREGDRVGLSYVFKADAHNYEKMVQDVRGVHWRKVRTEGCPPGWRWADAHEGCCLCILPTSAER